MDSGLVTSRVLGFSCGLGVAYRSSVGLLRANSPAIKRGHHGLREWVLISALSFDLMDQAYKRGGFDSTAIGFVGGAAMYTAPNWYLARRGAKHRKRSGGHQVSEKEQRGSGSAIAVGALLDGIPESIDWREHDLGRRR